MLRDVKTLADLGEFGLIARIRSRLARSAAAPGVVLGIGDDAAVLRPRANEDIVVSTDALVEGVHFCWQNETGRALGARILAVNLSDLAAMGARPLGAVIALAAPPGLAVRHVDGVLAGLAAGAARWGCPLVGGNIARARQTSWTVTILGAVRRGRELRRGRARPGDTIFVTGSLGRSSLARRRAERTGVASRYVPEPRLDVGRALGKLKARVSCIDISDGLASDLGQLLGGTGLEDERLGAEVDLAALPRPRGFAASCRRLHLDPATVLVSGGEDYELLFTLPRRQRFDASRFEAPVHAIGRVSREPGIRGLGVGADGFRHF